MLYDFTRHTSLNEVPWDEVKAREIIDLIFSDTINSLTANLWPKHPNEESETDKNKSFYYGAAGTLWTLILLSKKLEKNLPISPPELISKIKKDYSQSPDSGEIVPSFLIGQLGILLLEYKVTPTAHLEEEIFQCIQSNITNPCVDALWGASGTMIPAFYMIQWTDQKRWVDLFNKNVNFLLETWKFDSTTEAWYWEYIRGQRTASFIGAGHGFFGNIFPLLKGSNYISSSTLELIMSRTLNVTKKFAKVENNIANWPATFFGKGTENFLVQWCHGAPGMVQALSSIPLGVDGEFDNIYLKALELIWQAGPLKKGIGLCHGTDGNGLSLIMGYERTKDPKWLGRARKFAMHAISQRNGRHTLWTGDLGLAFFLQCCIDSTGYFPGIDNF